MKQYVKGSPRKRFLSKYRIDKETGCWNWFCALKNGYGLFWIDNKWIGAHRASWIIHNGAIPDGLNVLHKCDNPRCVNPSHLFLGTQKDNVDDMVNKGRHPRTGGKGKNKGINHGKAKLNEQDVHTIRQIRSKDKLSYNKIANIYDISKSTVQQIINRTIWRHI